MEVSIVMEVPKLAGWVLFGKFPSFEMDDVSRGTPMTKRKPPYHMIIPFYPEVAVLLEGYDFA